jgi:hypothetical protein
MCAQRYRMLWWNALRFSTLRVMNMLDVPRPNGEEIKKRPRTLRWAGDNPNFEEVRRRQVQYSPIYVALQ